MKRRLIPGLMLIAAFSLTNCSEQLAPPVVEENVILGETMVVPEDAVRTPYEIFVEGNETKTISNGESVYWVSEASAVANKMDRSAVDKINLFSISSTNGSSYTTHGEFEYVGNQTFSGNLNGSFEALPNSNNWLCLYPSSSVCTSSAATTDTPAAIAATVSIGTSELPGIVRGDKSHIAGTNYPMYGIKNNVPKDKTPKFKMSHLYALVALEIVNVGDGKADNDDQPITVNSVTFTAPDNIIGDFNVNVTNDKHTFSDPNPVPSSNSKSIALSGLKDTDGKTGITINPRESATLYFAIKPYDASGKELKISINGSEKTVKMPANTKFEEGKITTLKVPIKLSHPKETDATRFLTFNFEDAKSGTSQKITINGESINAYVLGYTQKTEKQWVEDKNIPILGGWWKDVATYKHHSIKVSGVVKDLFNALSAGFYASHWEGAPASMSVKKIDISLPNRNDDGKINPNNLSHISGYAPLYSGLRTSLSNGDDFNQWLASDGMWELTKALVYSIFSKGISRDEGMVKLTRFIDPSTITFNGIVSNGATNEDPKIFMLDDETIHKLVGKANIEKLLSTKFDYTTPLGEKLLPTYQGFADIINHSIGAPYSSEALKTGRAIYGKIKDKMGDETVSQDVAVGTIVIKLWDIVSAIFPNAEAMMEMLPYVQVSVEIDNYSKSDTVNPLIFWGFDINTVE